MNIADKRFLLTAIFISLFFLPEPLLGAYTLVLKNGRRITVQSYREEAGVVKIFGLGGEIGIPKDQIQAILEEGGEPDQGSLVLPTEGSTPEPPPIAKRKAESKTPEAKPGDEKGEKVPEEEAKVSEEPLPLTPEEEKAKLEQEYTEKVKIVTEKIKAAERRYQLATKGVSGPDPSVPVTQEQIQKRTDDLVSRLRDVQQRQSGVTYGSGPEVIRPDSFAEGPPLLEERPATTTPSVSAIGDTPTAKQKELSKLRDQIYQLQQERDQLIQEMRQKNLDTGSIFLE